MTQRNQAGQDAGAGEVSVECIEKETSRFWIFRARRNWSLVEPKTAPKPKKWRSEDQIRITTNVGRWIARKTVSTEVARVYTRMTLGSQNGDPGWNEMPR